ncbi:MAG: hypothetical protein JOZ51_12215, partial [Chloroflexi bacterium]|nr:hypothetical protein [Chloroflexota bacterium]
MTPARDPFGPLRDALLGSDEREPIAGYAHLDTQREHRKGVPEVILAEPKAPAQVVAIARHFLERSGRAIISRIPPETLAA